MDAKEWAIVGETEAFRAIGFRIIVLEDEFKSGLECKACDGKGHTNVQCSHCKGTGFWKADEENGSCPDCEVGTKDGRKSFGYELCSICNGKQALIIVPDSAKRRPMTGKVLSIGRKVTEFKPGDRVMYTNFTGTDFEIKGGIHLRIMLEHDVMSEYKQLSQDKTVQELSSGNKEMSEAGIAI